MKSTKAVIRDSCLVIRENLLAGLGVALLGVAGGTGKKHVACLVAGENRQAVLPARGTAAAHAAP